MPPFVRSKNEHGSSHPLGYWVGPWPPALQPQHHRSSSVHLRLNYQLLATLERIEYGNFFLRLCSADALYQRRREQAPNTKLRRARPPAHLPAGFRPASGVKQAELARSVTAHSSEKGGWHWTLGGSVGGIRILLFSVVAIRG